MGPVFAGMGAIYVVAAVLIFLRKSFAYVLTLFYATALIAAYFVTRDSLPIEAIGLAIKAVEIALLFALIGLLRVSAQLRSLDAASTKGGT